MASFTTNATLVRLWGIAIVSTVMAILLYIAGARALQLQCNTHTCIGYQVVQAHFTGLEDKFWWCNDKKCTRPAAIFNYDVENITMSCFIPNYNGPIAPPLYSYTDIYTVYVLQDAEDQVCTRNPYDINSDHSFLAFMFAVIATIVALVIWTSFIIDCVMQYRKPSTPTAPLAVALDAAAEDYADNLPIKDSQIGFAPPPEHTIDIV